MKLKTIFWVTLFAVTMGYFESAIVIYLRDIAYPGGFDFPLQNIDKHLATTEIFREVCSLIMLLSVAKIAGTSASTRFAYFIYIFAVWDIFYYIFLKVLIDWPSSLLTMDILFLLPTTWVGPVIAPVILSILMILFALLILYFSSRLNQLQLNTRELFMLITGSLIVILSFTHDYARFILRHYSFADIWTTPVNDLYNFSLMYYPRDFYWPVYWVGIIFILFGIRLFTKRNYLMIKKQ